MRQDGPHSFERREGRNGVGPELTLRREPKENVLLKRQWGRDFLRHELADGPTAGIYPAEQFVDQKAARQAVVLAGRVLWKLRVHVLDFGTHPVGLDALPADHVGREGTFEPKKARLVPHEIFHPTHTHP